MNRRRWPVSRAGNVVLLQCLRGPGATDGGGWAGGRQAVGG